MRCIGLRKFSDDPSNLGISWESIGSYFGKSYLRGKNTIIISAFAVQGKYLEVENMNMKIPLAAFAIVLIACAGIVLAMPGWNKKMMNPQGWQNETQQNSTCGGRMGPRFMDLPANESNRTMYGRRMEMDFDLNESNKTMHMRRMEMNMASFNSTAIEQFNQAVEDGDYQTAKQLHETYGLGGGLFDKLNETTFAKYSQIQKLISELRQELGMDGQSGNGPGLGEGFEMGPGFGGFPGNMGFGFGHGMRPIPEEMKEAGSS